MNTARTKSAIAHPAIHAIPHRAECKYTARLLAGISTASLRATTTPHYWHNAGLLIALHVLYIMFYCHDYREQPQFMIQRCHMHYQLHCSVMLLKRLSVAVDALLLS
jgi:hypothetical protein